MSPKNKTAYQNPIKWPMSFFTGDNPEEPVDYQALRRYLITPQTLEKTERTPEFLEYVHRMTCQENPLRKIAGRFIELLLKNTDSYFYKYHSVHFWDNTHAIQLYYQDMEMHYISEDATKNPDLNRALNIGLDETLGVWRRDKRLSKYKKSYCKSCHELHGNLGMEIEFSGCDIPEARKELLVKLNKYEHFDTRRADYGIDGGGDAIELRNINGQTSEVLTRRFAERADNLYKTLDKLQNKYGPMQLANRCAGIHIHKYLKNWSALDATVIAHGVSCLIVNSMNAKDWTARLSAGYGLPYAYRTETDWCRSNGVELRGYNAFSPKTLKICLDFEDEFSDRIKTKCKRAYGMLDTVRQPVGGRNQEIPFMANEYLAVALNHLELTPEAVAPFIDAIREHYSGFTPAPHSPIISMNTLQRTVEEYKTEPEMIGRPVTYPNTKFCIGLSASVGRSVFVATQSGMETLESFSERYKKHASECVRCQIYEQAIIEAGYELTPATRDGMLGFRTTAQTDTTARRRALRALRTTASAPSSVVERLWRADTTSSLI